jgi:hypothetical protein
MLYHHSCHPALYFLRSISDANFFLSDALRRRSTSSRELIAASLTIPACVSTILLLSYVKTKTLQVERSDQYKARLYSLSLDHLRFTALF